LEKVEIVRSVEKKIKNGDYKEALGEITKCLELCPNFITAKVLKAECLFHLGNYEEALAFANEVIFSAPDNIKARKIAVDANLELGNINEAKSHVDFLTFLLPANHSYLEEIKQKINEKENLASQISTGETFEIERNEVVEEEKKEEVREDDVTKVIEINENTEFDQEKDKQEIELDKDLEKSLQDIVSSNKVVVSDKEENADNDKPPLSFHSEDTIIEESDSGDFVISENEIDEMEHEIEVEEEKIESEIETVNKDEIVTGVLQEQVATVTLPDKKEEPEIKTRTLALIYERQGMLEEALEILENLYQKNQNEELLIDIDRIKAKLRGGEKSEYVMKKIEKLQNWLERIKWHSSA